MSTTPFEDPEEVYKRKRLDLEQELAACVEAIPEGYRKGRRTIADGHWESQKGTSSITDELIERLRRYCLKFVCGDLRAYGTFLQRDRRIPGGLKVIDLLDAHAEEVLYYVHRFHWRPVAIKNV